MGVLAQSLDGFVVCHLDQSVISVSLMKESPSQMQQLLLPDHRILENLVGQEGLEGLEY